MRKLVRTNILGVDIVNSSKTEVLEYLLEKLESKKQKAKIYTPNPEIVVYANEHPEFKKILNEADLAIPDGVGLILAGKILNKPIKERITGVDLMETICKVVSKKPISIGLLGGQKDVAEKAAECLIRKYTGLNIVFAASEWGEDGYNFQAKYKVASSKYQVHSKSHTTNYMLHTTIDMLFVAFGAPKQERWIAENIDRLPVKVMMGVGGAFDYISGEVSRAPRIFREFGFEWLYRLIRQPWRLKRQLKLVNFIYLVIKEKLKT